MSEEENVNEKGQKRSLLMRLLSAKINMPLDFIIIIIGLTVVATSYIMVKTPQLSLFINPQIANQNEADKLVEDVSKLISLPEEEKPLVVTIFDAELLSEQSFFEKVENGDKVLLYIKSRKAILYRPSENLIIEVGSVDIMAPR